MNPISKILITCSRGIVPYLADELKSLGFFPENTSENGVEISACYQDTIGLNLSLRTATNILFLLKEFSCRNPQQLYQKIYNLNWDQWIDPSEYMTVVTKVDTPSITNTMYPGMKVKDAIVDKILAKTGKRPDSGPKRNNVVLQLYWKHNTAKIYINTSGTKASDRGYRKIPHSAPMRESLASAVIMASEYQGQSVFVNPMCGSGTLAIEAALTAAGRSPGLLRSNYGFMHLKPFNSNNYKDVRNSLLKQQRKRNTTIPQIIATDIDPDAIEAAQKNAQTAGVDHLINFKVCDFAETPIPEQGGIVILNPEYGQRLGEIRDLEQTYSRIGDFFKQQCQGYTGYIFTGNLELAKKVGLRTSKRIPFYNGTIECRLLRYELYKGTNKKKYNKSDL